MRTPDQGRAHMAALVFTTVVVVCVLAVLRPAHLLVLVPLSTLNWFGWLLRFRPPELNRALIGATLLTCTVCAFVALLVLNSWLLLAVVAFYLAAIIGGEALRQRLEGSST